MKHLLLPFAACAAIAPCSSSSTDPTPAAVATDGGDTDSAIVDASAGTQCSTARDQLLLPIAKISSGVVTVLADAGGTRTLYVDASAGGFQAAAKSPRIDLGAGTRVAVTDESAPTSPDWDLSLKRYVIFINSGDVGSGRGGAKQIPKPFASVTDAEVSDAATVGESMFDADCNAKTDPTGAPLTTFSACYDRDEATMIPSPRPGVTYAVRGGTGGSTRSA